MLFRSLGQNGAIEPVGSVEISNTGSDLSTRPLSHRELQQPVILIQVEIQHRDTRGFLDTRECNRRPTGEAELLGCAAATDRDLEML